MEILRNTSGPSSQPGKGKGWLSLLRYIVMKAKLLQWGNQIAVHLLCAFDSLFR